MIHEIIPVGPLQCNCSIFGDEATREAIVIDPGDNIEELLAHTDGASADNDFRSQRSYGYEITDSTLTIRPIVARMPSFMDGGQDTYQRRINEIGARGGQRISIRTRRIIMSVKATRSFESLVVTWIKVRVGRI